MPAVFVIGFDELTEEDRTTLESAVAIFKKPVNPTTLLAIIHEALGQDREARKSCNPERRAPARQGSVLRKSFSRVGRLLSLPLSQSFAMNEKLSQSRHHGAPKRSKGGSTPSLTVDFATKLSYGVRSKLGTK